MSPTAKTIKLIMPQWQGGNNPSYQFGAELLAWLAPHSDIPTFRIPVAKPDKPLENENGMMGRKQIVTQLASAYQILEKNKPGKIIMLGGDCLVDLAPFSYLSSLYGNDFGILWLDAHPDVMTTEEFSHAHAHVLGALMGNGDQALTKDVTHPVPAQKVMIAGLHSPNDYEAQFIKQHAIATLSPEALKKDTTPLLDWIKQQKIKHLAIHFDLDVLDPRYFHSVLFANPDADQMDFEGIAQGRLQMSDVVNILNAVNQTTNIVGLGIAEHLPWDALNLKTMLAKLPLLKD